VDIAYADSSQDVTFRFKLLGPQRIGLNDLSADSRGKLGITWNIIFCPSMGILPVLRFKVGLRLNSLATRSMRRDFSVLYHSFILNTRMVRANGIGNTTANEGALPLFLVRLDHTGNCRGQVKPATITIFDHTIHFEICIRGRKDIERTYHKERNYRFPIVGHMNYHARH